MEGREIWEEGVIIAGDAHWQGGDGFDWEKQKDVATR
jgi:hypothetical protein